MAQSKNPQEQTSGRQAGRKKLNTDALFLMTKNSDVASLDAVDEYLEGMLALQVRQLSCKHQRATFVSPGAKPRFPWLPLSKMLEFVLTLT